MKFPFKLPNNVYDVLKWIVILFLPNAGSLYGRLAQIWGFPFSAEIVQTTQEVAAFLGIILCISQIAYNKENQDESVQ